MVLNDNFGKVLAFIFRPPSVGNGLSFQMVNTGGTLFNVHLYGLNGNTGRLNHPALTSRTKLGDGTTPATRQDFNVESELNDVPEKNDFNNNQAGYNSGLGKVSIASSVSPTGGSGAVTESINIQIYNNELGGNNNCILTRDVFSPVNFISGKTINVELSYLI